MKRGHKGSKLYVALVMPGSSAGVKYHHGVAWVSFFSCDMWVPLWVTGVGSVLHVYGVVRIIASLIPCLVCISLGETVVLLTTFNIYNFYMHNRDDIP